MSEYFHHCRHTAIGDVVKVNEIVKIQHFYTRIPHSESIGLLNF